MRPYQCSALSDQFCDQTTTGGPGPNTGRGCINLLDFNSDDNNRDADGDDARRTDCVALKIHTGYHLTCDPYEKRYQNKGKFAKNANDLGKLQWASRAIPDREDELFRPGTDQQIVSSCSQADKQRKNICIFQRAKAWHVMPSASKLDGPRACVLNLLMLCRIAMVFVVDFAATKVGTPPRALNLANTGGHLAFFKVVHRQRDDVNANTQSDHRRQAQSLLFRLHVFALLIRVFMHKYPPIVARLGQSFGNKRLIARQNPLLSMGN